MANFASLVGVTLTEVLRFKRYDSDVLEFRASDGRVWEMNHHPDCCENVDLDEVIGDLEDLVGTPIVEAREETNRDNPPRPDYSHTWTFYVLRTNKGSVTLRWLGESNGYYSESVDFDLVSEAQSEPSR